MYRYANRDGYINAYIRNEKDQFLLTSLKNVVRHKNLYQPRNGIHHQVASSVGFFSLIRFYLFYFKSAQHFVQVIPNESYV